MRHHRLVAAGAVGLALSLVATSCGGGGGDDADAAVIDTGDVVIQTDDLPTSSTTVAADPSGGAAEGDDDTGATETTIPLNEESAGTQLFDAVGVFMSCMDEFGGFIGVPSQSLPDTAPVNADEYREGLGTCAARSSIVDALGSVEDASLDLTPEEVETRNRNFLDFRDCLVGRGWTVPLPEPNEIGLLFGGNIARDALGWSAPDGESLFESDDLTDCGDGFGLGGGQGDGGGEQ